MATWETDVTTEITSVVIHCDGSDGLVTFMTDAKIIDEIQLDPGDWATIKALLDALINPP